MKKAKILNLPAGTKVPDHVVIIPDGDRRWARARGLTPSDGHRAGIENMANLAKACRDWGIHTVTSWGLSTENWLDRPQPEVNVLMKGIAGAIEKYLQTMKDDGVRLVHIGRKDRLPGWLMKLIRDTEEETRKNDKHVFNLALDYNGPDEIMRAVKRIIADGVRPEEVNRKLMDRYMDTSGQVYPYPDLIIRTSGEQRTSGILQWQSDYAEMYWELDHFPDFGPEKMRAAIMDYSRRRRRFGGQDATEHFKFNPKVVARLELDLRRETASGGKRLPELAVEYLKQQYGMSKQLAKLAGKSLLAALVFRRKSDWVAARGALEELYEVIKKNVGLALEPEIVASIEVGTWKKKANEEDVRQLLAEKFRFSSFQAAKSAHLAVLADEEASRGNWEKATDYIEKYYQALKERVA